MLTGIKTSLINNYSEQPHGGLRFYTGNTPSATVAGSDRMSLGGVVDIKLSEVANVRAYRGFSNAKQVLTFDTSNTASFNIEAPAVDSYVSFEIFREGLEYEAIYADTQLRFIRTKPVQIKVPATVTNDQAGARVITELLYDAISYQIKRFGADSLGFTVSFTGANKSTMDTLVFTALSEKVKINKVQFVDDEGEVSDIITSFTPAETVAQTEGRNTGLFLQENEFLLTGASTLPYNKRSNRLLANESSNYTGIQFSMVNDRYHYGISAMGQQLSTKTDYLLYVEENADNLSTSVTLSNGSLVSTGAISAMLQFLGQDGKNTNGFAFYNENFGNPASSVSEAVITGTTAWNETTHSGALRTSDTTLSADITQFID